MLLDYRGYNTTTQLTIFQVVRAITESRILYRKVMGFFKTALYPWFRGRGHRPSIRLELQIDVKWVMISSGIEGTNTLNTGGWCTLHDGQLQLTRNRGVIFERWVVVQEGFV